MFAGVGTGMVASAAAVMVYNTTEDKENITPKKTDENTSLYSLWKRFVDVVSFLAVNAASAVSRQHFECSPTFNGVPVAATILLYQAQSIFGKEFPGLEIAAVFEVRPQKRYGFFTRDDVERETGEKIKSARELPGVVPVDEDSSKKSYLEEDANVKKYTEDHFDEYNYREYGGYFPFERMFPGNCEVIVPIFEKLSELEEARLGEAGLAKPIVARMRIRGECSAGCAKVRMQSLELYKLDGEVVWTWNRPQVQRREASAA